MQLTKSVKRVAVLAPLDKLSCPGGLSHCQYAGIQEIREDRWIAVHYEHCMLCKQKSLSRFI